MKQSEADATTALPSPHRVCGNAVPAPLQHYRVQGRECVSAYRHRTREGGFVRAHQLAYDGALPRTAQPQRPSSGAREQREAHVVPRALQRAKNRLRAKFPSSLNCLAATNEL